MSTKNLAFLTAAALISITTASRPSYAIWPFDESKQWFKCQITTSTHFLGYSVPFTSGSVETDYIAVNSKDIFAYKKDQGVASLTELFTPIMKKAAAEQDAKNKSSQTEIQRSFSNDGETALLTLRTFNADLPSLSGVFQMRLNMKSGEFTMTPVGVAQFIPSDGVRGTCVQSSAP